MAAADGPEEGARQAIWLKAILVAKPIAANTSAGPLILFIAVSSDSPSMGPRCGFRRNAQTRVKHRFTDLHSRRRATELRRSDLT
ncbi:MAG: hypothetical protein IID42_08490 [Planctomycetes bacterium]|nr:hypothetical protein [Planctomycetota bacterium]